MCEPPFRTSVTLIVLATSPNGSVSAVDCSAGAPRRARNLHQWSTRICQTRLPVGRQDSESQYAGIVSVLIKGLPSDTAASVFAEQNIAVRSGLQCAPLAHKTLGTFPAGTVRFSTSYFTSDEDFMELEKAMEWIRENI